MTRSTQPKTWVRVASGLVALAFSLSILALFWPVVKVVDLYRADLGYQGRWIEGYAKRIETVTAGGAADRAGLKPGDVLEFDPARNDDWILASYRDMPEGFSGTLPVRHADGSRASASLVPERVAYLPEVGDRVALVARLVSLTMLLVVAVALVWARPGVMTWSLLLWVAATGPGRVSVPWFLAFDAVGQDIRLRQVLVTGVLGLSAMVVPFALCFPRGDLRRWAWWKKALGLMVVAGGVAAMTRGVVTPFSQDTIRPVSTLTWVVYATASLLIAIAALGRTYRAADNQDRARMRWGTLGLVVAFASALVAVGFVAIAGSGTPTLSGASLTPVHWTNVIGQGILFPLAIGYAVLRERVIDVQFAISRTVVYGVVSTIVLVFLAVLHWLLGRMIEHSGFAFGLEGLAAVGLGLVLHRASRGINTTVDRVLFRKHHAAEERLRRVTAALPFATDERSIAEALVKEPVRNLDLASAALFYRDSPAGPLRRVPAHGWSGEHAASLDADSLLVRYLQAEHEPLKLDDPHLLPAALPEGAALPVLAIPIVTQHSLNAVVLYGAHVNGTLLDPDEIELLHALAKAAATSHQQVRIATLAREVETQKIKNEQLEASFRVLAQGRAGTRPTEEV